MEIKTTKGKAANKETSSNLSSSGGTAAEGVATTTGTSGSTTINPQEAYGWICPKCGRVNAPWKGTCDCFKDIGAPSAPPNTSLPFAPFYAPYIPHIETPNPFDLYGPYKWGDAPGWWQWGPTCQGGGLGNPIPCSLDDVKKIIESNKLNTSTISTSDPNIKWSTWSCNVKTDEECVKPQVDLPYCSCLGVINKKIGCTLLDKGVYCKGGHTSGTCPILCGNVATTNNKE